MFLSNSDFKIKTPEGFEDFDGILVKQTDELRIFQFDDKSELKCSSGHALLTDSGFKRADEITIDDCITGKFIKRIGKRKGKFDVYDPVGVKNNVYQQPSGVISHNTEFIGSGATLISPSKLGNMSYVNPIRKHENVDFYEEPKPGHTYFLAADSARGLRMDYSAFVVIDVTNSPYKVVAKYRDNTVTPIIYPHFIFNVAQYYNNAHVLTENNDVGGQVGEAVLNLGYENMLWTVSRGRSGFVLGQGKGAKLGVTTSSAVKRKGCSNLKSLVETDQLIIEDYDIFVELTTFARKNELSTESIFEAEPGCNDDLVMCLVLFSWSVMSDYWKELTNIDVADKVFKEKQDEEEEEEGSTVPLGFANINTYDTFSDHEGTQWQVVGEDNLPEWWNELFVNTHPRERW